MDKKKIIFGLIFFSFIFVGGFFGFQKMKKTLAEKKQTIKENSESVIELQKKEEKVVGDLETKINQEAQDEEIENQNKASKKALTGEKTVKEAVVQEKAEAIGGEDKDAGKIVQRLVSWGFQKSVARKIDTLIVHSSYDAIGKDPYDISGIIEEYRQAQVSAHYLIARDGTIYQLVADQNIAWHAGVAKMPDGRTDVNSFSIGVEMVNTKEGKFTNDQYASLNSLIATLKGKYPIKNILGHSDVAPGRKTDPWGIEWKKVVK
ncbi:MAG: N-acetylmuramoyl-L-alanine amidase [Candidatus Moranbacteria bacterium]|nr:N-acetylmuramoyl-L-alanine amidase [Candidatus Moranbacteria bacterium]